MKIGQQELEKLVEDLLGEKTSIEKKCHQFVKEDSKKFEWVVVAKALEKGHGVQINFDELDGINDDDKDKLKCARKFWYGLSDLGVQADQLLNRMEQSAFFSPDHFKNAKTASMAGLKKIPLVRGGRGAEVKSDVVFGQFGISLKKGGAVQLASAEFPSTAEALKRIFAEWGSDKMRKAISDAQKNIKPTIKDIMERTLVPKMESIVSTMKNTGAEWDPDDPEVMVRAKRYIQQNKIENVPSQQEIDAEQDATKKIKLERGKDKFDQLVAGEYVRKNKDNVYEIIEGSYEELEGNLKKTLFQDLINIMNTSPELHRIILDEMATGRRQFIYGPEIAQYFASPDHVMSLNPDDGDEYKKTLNFLQKAVPPESFRIAAKGRGAFTAITLRPDLKEKAMKAAHESLQENQNLKLEEGVVDSIKSVFQKGINIIKNFSSQIKNKITDLFSREPVQIENTVENILENPQDYFYFADTPSDHLKEHLTNTPLSYTMLTEMIEDLLSKE